MFVSEREIALDRTRILLERKHALSSVKADATDGVQEKMRAFSGVSSTRISSLLFQAGLRAPAMVIVLSALLLGTVLAFCSGKIVSPYFVPIFFLAGFCIPFSWLQSKVSSRGAEFSADYPTVLLATASSIKVGMTPYLALERSIRLLPKQSLMRREVESMLMKLQKGVIKEEAIGEFGASVRQPELPLFRKALLLVVEHGGKFAPTLERLARVSRDRATLTSEARVSTANMRMTANILLVAAPVIVAIVALRTPDFWELLLHHPVANFLASTGLVVILGSYLLLRKMSSFKP